MREKLYLVWILIDTAFVHLTLIPLRKAYIYITLHSTLYMSCYFHCLDKSSHILSWFFFVLVFMKTGKFTWYIPYVGRWHLGHLWYFCLDRLTDKIFPLASDNSLLLPPLPICTSQCRACKPIIVIPEFPSILTVILLI